MSADKISEGERLIKLALFIKKHAPVDFVAIRRGLHEYAFVDGVDEDTMRKHDQKIRRMFERDKATLASCGIFIEVDEDNRYSLDAQASYAAPLDLMPSQASLLRLMCTSLLENDSYPLKSELRMVLAKIGDELELPDLLPSGDLGARSNAPSGFKKIRKSIESRKHLSFDYRNANGRESSREVEPFGGFFLNKHCYVIAYDPAADGERCFRLDRMSHVSVNSTSPNVPDFEPRRFDAEDWYGLPFMFGDTSFAATVRFDEDNAWRAERLSMQLGTFEETDDGLLWHTQAASADALAQWCIENGPGIVPSEPLAAREAYRAALVSALEAHGEVQR